NLIMSIPYDQMNLRSYFDENVNDASTTSDFLDRAIPGQAIGLSSALVYDQALIDEYTESRISTMPENYLQTSSLTFANDSIQESVNLAVNSDSDPEYLYLGHAFSITLNRIDGIVRS